MIREINFPLSFIGHRVRKGVCVCVCVCVHTQAIASSLVEIQSFSGPGSDSCGIDWVEGPVELTKRKQMLGLILKLRPNTYCQGMLIPSPGFRSQVERKTLLGSLLLWWVLGVTFSKLLKAASDRYQRIALTQASLPWCSFFSWMCVLMGVSNKESLEWKPSISKKSELIHQCGVGGEGGSGDRVAHVKHISH